MGAVFEVEDVQDGARLALKVMHPDLYESDPRALHRFEREARLSAGLEHPNIARTVATGVDTSLNMPWMVMELLGGETLGSWIGRDGAPATAVARRVLDELFSAVAYAHEKGVFHRDLKPENIFVTRQSGDELGPVKILDFGIAKVAAAAGVQASMTASGLGTPIWAAPEQGNTNHRPDAQNDVWALGLLAFFVLTGKIYWKSAGGRASMVDLAMELLRDTVVAPSLRAEEIGVEAALPRGFDGWFLRSVCRDKAARYEDATRARAALDSVLTQLP